MSDNGEKVFHYYLNFPNEMRMEILKAMQPDDRCRFTRCSQLSKKEVKASKFLIDELAILACDEMVNIHVRYGDDIEYSLKYMNFDEKYVECNSTDEKFVWREDLDSSTDIVLRAAEKFKELLEMYQNKVQTLAFIGTSFDDKLKDFDFEIEKLTNLRSLCLHQEADPQHYFAKIRQPLESLSVWKTRNDSKNMANYQQIYEVEKSLHIDHLKLNKEQFARLSATDVEIHIGQLTVEDIYVIIRSWQNGKTGKNVKKYKWRLQSSDFDHAKLFRLLGMRFDDVQDPMIPQEIELEIKHDKEAGKTAKLCFRDIFRVLTFVVKNDNGEYTWY